MPLDLARQVGELQGQVHALERTVIDIHDDVRKLLKWAATHEGADEQRSERTANVLKGRANLYTLAAGMIGAFSSIGLETIAKRLGWLCIAVVLAWPIVVRGAPPENADPALAPWFQSLHNAAGAFCCDQADGRATEHVRVANDGSYSALIDERWNNDPPAWVPVPKGAVLDRPDNPTGRYVVFWTAGAGVICLVRPAEG